MLDPLGLSPIAPNMPRGIFGGTRRKFMPTPSTPPGNWEGQGAAPQISEAPAPPTDWKNIVGPELLANLSQVDPYANRGIGAGSGVSGPPATVLQGDAMSPAPIRPRGLIAPPRSVGPMSPGGSDGKIANHGTPQIPDANGKGKKGFDWGKLIGVLGDSLSIAGGGRAQYVPHLMEQRVRQSEHQDRMAQMQEQARIKMSEPDYATINNRRVRIDPTTGQAEVLYTAPQDFDDYAAALGAEPGTEQYDRLVQDYVLRHSGPTATDFNLEEEDHRQDNRISLEGIRQSNRSTLEGQRQSGRRALKTVPTYRQANPAPPRAGGGSRSGTQEGATATNPQTGAKVVYRGGKWVPVK